MLTFEPVDIQNELNKEAIRLQLYRILADPIFSRSRILQGFLRFIIEETLLDRTNCLKEYTIGVKVLGKPVSFNPQSTSIVRIHAVRLRKALDSYYINRGVNDLIRISLPPGHYIPVFLKIDVKTNNSKDKVPGLKEGIASTPRFPLVVAVMPFYTSHGIDHLGEFSDGLGALLANALMESGTASVISYFSTRRLAKKFADIREIAKRIDAKYIFTGDVQVIKGKIRISVQLVSAETGYLEWFQAIESKFSPEKIFDLQNQLVNKLIISVVEKTSAMLEIEVESRKSMMAVA